MNWNCNSLRLTFVNLKIMACEFHANKWILHSSCSLIICFSNSLWIEHIEHEAVLDHKLRWKFYIGSSWFNDFLQQDKALTGLLYLELYPLSFWNIEQETILDINYVNFFFFFILVLINSLLSSQVSDYWSAC